MKGITIKLPDDVLRRLGSEARATGQSIAAVVRSKLDAEALGGTVHERAGDLAGVLSGGRRPASNARRKFRRAR